MSELFNWTIEDFINELTFQVVILVILGVAGLIFNKKIRKFVSTQYRKISDLKTGTVITFIQKYSEPPIQKFGYELFDELKSHLQNDTITSSAINPNFLKIHSRSLKMKFRISLEEEPDLSTIDNERPEIKSYNVTISLDNEIVGLKQLDKIQDVTDLVILIQHKIQRKCFPNSEVRQSFVTCDISDISPKPRNENKEDENLHAKITFLDHDMTITSNDPQKLAKTVKKYVYA